ncbi:hypothetical protein EW145_g5319 [Phellinidium pouzarii]|uniref:DNA-directed RNA polymerases I and III subunit RPAC1 n=1 Tax=Phellinidium pouzarii TaxID=167371 RepID=A0A4S4L0D5_9AGAM|nr:hypothetical protein EW145_g5319 [Phellinidium pouzarii]
MLVPADISDRRLVGVHAEHVSNVSSSEFPGHYPDEDYRWDLTEFKRLLHLDITRLSQRSIELDLVGVDASIANAVRRTLIADVPTLCIEAVFVWNNTSLIHDEILSHRLGLIPLNADPSFFQMRGGKSSRYGYATPRRVLNLCSFFLFLSFFLAELENATDRDTLVFRLEVSCTRNPAAPPHSNDPEELYIDHIVTSGMLKWVPQGEQAELPQFQRKPPGPTNPNIVLAKLRPGQTIMLECHAIKGYGREHAKWSPVATATYRLHPSVKILRQPPPHLVRKFADCFSPGVIKIIGEGKPEARVEVDAWKERNESMSREIFRHPEFADCVKLGRVRNWFLFSIESEGPYAPEDLFPTAMNVLRTRIDVLRRAVEALVAGNDETPEEEVDEEGAHGGGADVVMMDL